MPQTPIQISQHPEIHELVHSIMQLASKCKQEINREHGVELDRRKRKADLIKELKKIKRVGI